MIPLKITLITAQVGSPNPTAGSVELRAHASFDSQQMKQIKQIGEQKAGGRLNHLLNLFNLL